MTRDPDPERHNRSTAIVVASQAPISLRDDIRMQKLWLATQRRDWRSLAVVAAGKAVPTLQVAELIAQLAWRYRGEPSNVCDLRDLSLRLVDYQLREVRMQVESGARVIIALRSIFENPTASSIAQKADAVLLCVVLGETEVKAAEQTIVEVGRDRVIGSVIVRTAAARRSEDRRP